MMDDIICIYIYTLWLFNIAMDNGLPINSMVIFHGYVSHNQMVYMYLSRSTIRGSY